MSHIISTTRSVSRTENMWSKLHPPEAKIGCRHIQVFLLHLSYFCAYGIKVLLSITLVAMTKSDSANPDIKHFNWSDSIQNSILSSFFWGFTATQMPGAVIAQRFGAQKFICFAIGICGVVTVLTPVAALYGGWQGLIVMRILAGTVEGVTPPCVYVLLSKWVPVVERARAGSCIHAGGALGNVIALLSCGAISKSILGWPSCFYIWGGMAILWALLYYFIGKQSPSAHPSISINEKEYIESSLGDTVSVKVLRTPWIAILTSPPFWGLLIAQCADSWGYWMLFTKVPTYMAHVLGYNIFENGIVSAVPYLVAFLLSFLSSFIYDKLVQSGCVSLEVMRKTANTVGQFGPACALIAFGFINIEHRTFAVGILIVSMGCNASVFSGYLINHVDLSPNYAGTLMGIINTVANIFGILAPLICGVIVTDVTDIHQWRKVFLLSAGVYIFGNIAFLLLGDAEVQPWNETAPHSKVDNKTSIIPKITIAPEKTHDNNNIDVNIR